MRKALASTAILVLLSAGAAWTKPAPASRVGITPVPPTAEKPAGDTRRVWGDLYPPAPFEQVLKQPDGTSFQARLTPAEIGGSLEVNGYTVTRGPDRVWRYATGRRDGNLLASDRVVGTHAPPAGIATGAGRTPNLWLDGRGRDMRTEALRTLQIASYRAQMTAAAAGEPRIFRFPVLMLSTWWDEDAGQTEPQFQEGSNTPEVFKRLLDGFGGNPTGSLTEFYFEDSLGQFLVQVDVYGPYTSQRSRQDRCYYGGIETATSGGDLDPVDDALGVGGGGALGMAVEAVPQADPEVGFAQYDNDGDQVVDFVGLVHSGPDMAVTGDPCHTWSHAFQVGLVGAAAEDSLGLDPGTLKNGLATSDGVVVDRVFTMPEFGDQTHPLTIGVASHEMAHALGEPDYYNTTYSSMGTGDWDIMSGGSYLGNPAGSNPSGFNPTSRVFQGWLKPTVVTNDRRGVRLQPRHLKPAGYTVDRANPNVILIPTKEIAVGETDAEDHAWTENDVYGLAVNPATGKYVIEGYYVENMNRTATAPAIHKDMTRSPYFDRQLLGSGIMVWHFDYWLRSNVYFGSNNAQNDANRPQMDTMEFDFNDNTQEQQLSFSRGNPEDLLFGAATGITSGTRKLQPGIPPLFGTPQARIEFTGVVPPAQTFDNNFTVEDDPDNYLMTVKIAGLGDCTLQLLYEGKAMGGVVDGGFVGDEEIIRVVQPKPGNYTARVGDFAGCGPYDGSVEFENAKVFSTKGAADTWSNWSEKPTGWAITNVGPREFDGLDQGADSSSPEAVTLDLVQIGASEADISPGFITGATNVNGGRGAIIAGRSNSLKVPAFNNGGKPVSGVRVEVHTGSATGPVVASKTVSIGAYTRTEVPFTYAPAGEGPQDLWTTVDSPGTIAEAHEGNNSQKSTVWVGPANPKVLVIDDDGYLDGEVASAGALASLGIPYAIAAEHPTAAELSPYKAVVWMTGGERYQGQLDVADRTALRAYLNAGGKLFFGGPRIVDALGEAVGRTNPGGSEEGQAFLKQYFGAEFIRNAEPNDNDLKLKGTGSIFGTSTFEVSQIPGRFILNVMSKADYTTEGSVPAFGTPTPVLALAGAPAGEFVGMKVEGDSAHGRFQTVVLGFNLLTHTSSDEQVKVMRTVMTHFGIPLGSYAVAGTEPLIYHAAVRNQVSGRPIKIRAVVLGGEAGAPVTLHYRRHGRGAYYSQTMTRGVERGAFRGTIPGNAVTADGLDYYIKAGSASTYDPPGARNGAVVHAVGVALPEVSNPIAVLAAVTQAPLPATGVGTGALGFVLVGLAASLASRLTGRTTRHPRRR